MSGITLEKPGTARSPSGPAGPGGTVLSSWWTIGLRGVVALIFGIVAVVQPRLIVLVLVTFFAVYALIDGILALASGVWAAEHQRRWWPFLLEGVVGVAFGIFTLARPAITAVVLMLFIAWWAIITGALEIAGAVMLRRVIAGEWMLAASGVVSALFGALLLAFPLAGAISVVWVLGIYGIIFGLLLLALSVRLRRLTAP